MYLFRGIIYDILQQIYIPSFRFSSRPISLKFADKSLHRSERKKNANAPVRRDHKIGIQYRMRGGVVCVKRMSRGARFLSFHVSIRFTFFFIHLFVFFARLFSSQLPPVTQNCKYPSKCIIFVPTLFSSHSLLYSSAKSVYSLVCR